MKQNSVLKDKEEVKKKVKKAPKPVFKSAEAKIDTFTIHYKGKFCVNKLYDDAVEWLEDNDYEVDEKTFEMADDEKIIELEANKIEYGFTRTIEFYFRFVGDFNVELGNEKDEEKRKFYPYLDSGRIEVVINGKITLVEKDYFGRNFWMKNKVSLFFWKLYSILSDKGLQDYKRNVRKDMAKLTVEAKKSIGMTFL